MAALSSFLMTGAAAASAAMGVAKTVQGNKEMKLAQDKIDNYQRQSLENTLRGVALPQQMYNLQNEQLERSMATAQEAAIQGGARGMAMLPALQQNEFEAQQQINADLEKSLYNLSLAQAQEDARIQQMTERREEQELAGYGAMYEAGRQTKYGGMGDIVQGVQALGYQLGQMDMGLPPNAARQETAGYVSMSDLNAYTGARQQMRQGVNTYVDAHAIR